MEEVKESLSLKVSWNTFCLIVLMVEYFSYQYLLRKLCYEDNAWAVLLELT